MNLRHAAALALVGWYLMMPPDNWTLCSKSVADCEAISDAPLGRWNTTQSFDSANQCEQARSVWEGRGTKDFNAAKFNSYETLTTSRSTRLMLDQGRIAARCVSTDDPRLKEK